MMKAMSVIPAQAGSAQVAGPPGASSALWPDALTRQPDDAKVAVDLRD
jgi:hypothetical protein